MLRENTLDFRKRGNRSQPITGFSCWALGYLDSGFRQAGCLLHPARHSGEDLRYRVDFGEKCKRESCPESKTFLKLSAEARGFWLYLAEGLDTFQYSSRCFNPLFNLMGWGPWLLEKISLEKRGRNPNRTDFFVEYPVLNAFQDPRPCAYLLTSIVRQGHIHYLETSTFSHAFQDFSSRLMADCRASTEQGNAPHTHLLALDPQFLDFLRLGLGIKKIREETACLLKEETDRSLGEFMNLLESDKIGP